MAREKQLLPPEQPDPVKAPEQHKQSLGPEPVKPPPPSVVPAGPETGKTADALLAHLRETGTPEAKLKPLAAWVQAHHDSPAERLYQRLEESPEINQGTLRKSGQWLWGPTFEPERAVLIEPGEEIERLRTELAQAQEWLTREKAEKRGLVLQLQHAREQINDLSRQVAVLKVGAEVVTA